MSVAKSISRICTFEQLFHEGWRASTLSEKIDEVMDAFPIPEIPGNQMGSSDAWQQIYEQCPRSGYMIFGCSAELVAFWHCIPVRERVYDDIRAGNNVNGSITTADLNTSLEPGVFEWYFVDMFLRKDWKTRQAREALFGSIGHFVKNELAAKRRIKRVVAHLSSAEVEHVCGRAGFKCVTHHKEHRIWDEAGRLVPTKIFELDVEATGVDAYLRRLSKIERGVKVNSDSLSEFTRRLPPFSG